MPGISFIVIGRNVASTIMPCLQSIITSCIATELQSYEIIYIDSQSDDGTVEIVSGLNWVKSFRISGAYNAAVARNIGAKEATHDILFFIDGDMTLDAGFLSIVLTKGDQSLTYPFVSGNLVNCNYDSNGNFLGETPYFGSAINKDRFEVTTGGVFIITATLWNNCRGMDTRLKRGEDIDIGLRLSRRGFRLLRKQELIVKHYTISYFDPKRSLHMLTNGDFCYAGLTCRIHIFNPHFHPFFFRNYYAPIILTLCLGLLPLTYGMSPLLYLLLSTARAVKRSRTDKLPFIRHLFFYTIVDLEVIVGFFFLFPSTKKLCYEPLQSSVTHVK